MGANLVQIQTDSDWGQASSNINQNFAQLDVAVEAVKNATVKFKGYFSTEEALKSAYPSPKNGDTAWVGTPYPGKVYEVKNGQWSNTDTVPETGEVNLADYAKKEELSKLNSDVSVLEKKINSLGLIVTDVTLTTGTAYGQTKWIANKFDVTQPYVVNGIDIYVAKQGNVEIGIANLSTKQFSSLYEKQVTEGLNEIRDININIEPNCLCALRSKVGGVLCFKNSYPIGSYYDDGGLESDSLCFMYNIYGTTSDSSDIQENIQEIKSNIIKLESRVEALENSTPGGGQTPSESTDVTLTTGTAYIQTKWIANKFDVTQPYVVNGIDIYVAKQGNVEIGIASLTNKRFTSLYEKQVAEGLNEIRDINISIEPNCLCALRSKEGGVLYFKQGYPLGSYYDDGSLQADNLCFMYNIYYGNSSVEPPSDSDEIDAIWCSLGTSITWYNNNTSGLFEKGYQDRVLEVIKIKKFINKGINGGTIVGLVKSLSGIPYADYYTIEHGINDWGQSTEVGTIEDYKNNTGTNTFFGAYRAVIDYLYSINPSAKIILCTPRKAYGFNGYLPTHWYDIKSGIYLEDYAKAVIEIAKFESLPVADFFYESQANQTTLESLSIDIALHPNDDGYQYMANLVIHEFKKLLRL